MKIITLILVLFSSVVYGRSIYLNGFNISSAYNQTLKQVDIHIDKNGNIFITAPHYQVNEEDTYLPLSSLSKSPKNRNNETKKPNKMTTPPKNTPKSEKSDPEIKQK